MATEDEMIAQYSGITGESAAKSRQDLEACDWSLEAAIEEHYARVQDSDNDADYQDEEPQEQSTNVASGGRRLGDAPLTSQSVSTPATSSSKPQAKPTTQKRFATLGDVSSAAANEESDSDDGQDMFAGGEKSGLAVQNPGEDLKKKIIDKARRGGKKAEEEEPKKKSHFIGSARTLGGDDTPSREIQGETPKADSERVKRILHFWQDGFSIDDGELYRFDDAANAQTLQLIRSGRAPLHIMNVAPGQEVDVSVVPHEEAYVKPKATYKPFQGQGHRLGSPTPGVAATSPMPGSFSTEAPAASSSTATPPATSQVDESKPIVTLRISLGTGTRMTSRFNADQTMGDVYEFVRRSEPSGRNFVLQTTFPTKEMTDQSQVLSEIPEFKRGGAVVQKYV